MKPVPFPLMKPNFFLSWNQPFSLIKPSFYSPLAPFFLSRSPYSILKPGPFISPETTLSIVKPPLLSRNPFFLPKSVVSSETPFLSRKNFSLLEPAFFHETILSRNPFFYFLWKPIFSWNPFFPFSLSLKPYCGKSWLHISSHISRMMKISNYFVDLIYSRVSYGDLLCSLFNQSNLFPFFTQQ